MKIIFKLFLLILIFHYNLALTQESHNLNSDIASGVIYEANIRQYSKEGTFNAFTRDIPVLRDLGIKVIWLMPVNPISTTSNYISSYMTPKPLYAQNDAAKKLANINDDNNSNNNKVIQQLTQTTGASQSMHGSELNATQMQMSLYEIFLTVVHDQKLVVEKKPPAEPPPILSSSQIESLSPIHFECDQLNFKHIRA